MTHILRHGRLFVRFAIKALIPEPKEDGRDCPSDVPGRLPPSREETLTLIDSRLLQMLRFRFVRFWDPLTNDALLLSMASISEDVDP